MNRSLLIKLVVTLLVVVLLHSVFWFFKTGQLEKHINNFVAENSANVSIGEISVSGYPFSQKVVIKDLKFTLPYAAFSKSQILIKEIEAKSGIFSSSFVVENLNQATIQDANGNVGNIEFNQMPQISFVISGAILANFSYSDVGYRIFDANKNVIYSAASSNINIASSIDSNDQITTKISAIVKEIEGFDLVDIYKNSSEKKIIDGIKTGEISINNSNNALIGTDPVALAANAGASNPQEVAKIIAPVIAAMPTVPAVAAAVNVDGVAKTSDDNAAKADLASQNQGADNQLDVASIVAKNDAVRNNLVVDIEYILTPDKNEKVGALPLDPAQMQGESVQYSRAVKVNNIEFSNALYKINLNGQVNYFQDDNLPSGFITLKIDNLDKVLDYVVQSFSKISEPQNKGAEVQAVDLPAQNNQQVQADAYQEFLKKISAGIASVSKELATKNQLSKDNVAVFDMRREKNLEFVINETPLREVLGKF